MDFSWSYLDTMRRLVGTTGYRGDITLQDNYFPTSLVFDLDLNTGSCDVPVFCANKVVEWNEIYNRRVKVIIPLGVDYQSKQCSGAETMLKFFSRHYCYGGRISKAVTPKGEVYYGANGIVLDRDFNPLLLTTVNMERGNQEYGFSPYIYHGVTVHISPGVFLDDTSLLNKHLAKKGMACFLGQNINSFGATGPVKVTVEDCSKYFRKPAKPSVTSFSDESVHVLLEDSIGDILEQFSLDYRIYG